MKKNLAQIIIFNFLIAILYVSTVCLLGALRAGDCSIVAGIRYLLFSENGPTLLFFITAILIVFLQGIVTYAVVSFTNDSYYWAVASSIFFFIANIKIMLICYEKEFGGARSVKIDPYFVAEALTNTETWMLLSLYALLFVIANGIANIRLHQASLRVSTANPPSE